MGMLTHHASHIVIYTVIIHPSLYYLSKKFKLLECHRARGCKWMGIKLFLKLCQKSVHLWFARPWVPPLEYRWERSFVHLPYWIQKQNRSRRFGCHYVYQRKLNEGCLVGGEVKPMSQDRWHIGNDKLSLIKSERHCLHSVLARYIKSREIIGRAKYSGLSSFGCDSNILRKFVYPGRMWDPVHGSGNDI